MKLFWKKLHPLGVILSVIFISLAVNAVIKGENDARKRENIIEEKKLLNPQEITRLQEKLKDAHISEDEKMSIQGEIEIRKEYGWFWTSYYLPSNARNPARVLGIALFLAGIACLFYRPKKRIHNNSAQ